MSLVGIDKGSIGQDLVVAGDWKSADGIDIHISSALVTRRKGRKLANELLEESDAFHVWLPTLQYDDEELDHLPKESREFRPWIVCPSLRGWQS